MILGSSNSYNVVYIVIESNVVLRILREIAAHATLLQAIYVFKHIFQSGIASDRSAILFLESAYHPRPHYRYRRGY